MTEDPKSKKRQTQEYFVRHFSIIMILLAIIGLVLVIIGSTLNIGLLVSVSTTVFSVATLGAIFKVLGYDVYILNVLRDIVYERKFLDMLMDAEKRGVIRTTIESLRKRKLADEIYSACEDYVIDEMAEISRNDRLYKIDLEYTKKLGSKLICGKSVTQYNALNEAASAKPLFAVFGESHVVSRGSVTIPTIIKHSQIPNDPKAFWNMDTANGLRIGSEDATPEVDIGWKDDNNHSKGVKYEVKCEQEIAPSQDKFVTWKNTCLYCTNDYIVKRVAGFTRNVEIMVNKPADLEIFVVWFLTAKGQKNGIVEHPAEQRPRSFYQKVEGVLLPGNGFVLMWWPKRK